jgi:5-methylcytosine-specific restriction endonuclease McrA
MRRFKTFSNRDLHSKIGILFEAEREIFTEIIEHVAEAIQRQLYYDFEETSIFAYLTKQHKYPNGSAQRVIDASRVYLEVPEVIDDLQSGEINASQITLLQKACREKGEENISQEVKAELLSEIRGRPVEASEILISQKLGIPVKEKTKVRHQADGSVRLEVTFSKEQWGKMELMRDLESHALPDGSGWDQVFEHAADKLTRNRMGKARSQPQKTNSKPKDNATNQATPAPSDPSPVSEKPESLYQLGKKVLSRDQCCQFKHPKTGKICGSRWKMQIDHRKPRWAGGEDSLENLQVLCAAHNLQKYRQEAGIRRRSTN